VPRRALRGRTHASDVRVWDAPDRRGKADLTRRSGG